MHALGRGLGRGITRNVVALAVVSLLTDVSSEMLVYLVPLTKPAVAAEFVTASLTSQNLDDKMGWGYRSGSLEVERELMAALPSIRWCDLDSHGYMVVDVTAERVQVEHWFVDEILQRTSGERLAARWQVRPGSPHIERVDDPPVSESPIGLTAS